MEIGELMELVRGSLTEEDFIPIKRLKDKQFVEQLQNTMSVPTYEQVVEVAKKLGEPIERFYINLKTLFSPVVYFYNGFLMEIHAFDDDYLKSFQVKKVIKTNLNLMEKALQKNDYEELFIRMDSKVKIMMFKRLFNEIPDKDLYDIFLMVYAHVDYGFTEIDQKFFSRIIKCKSAKQQQEMERKLKKKIDKDGFIQVYRGVGSKSTPPEQAYSWTTSINTAAFFATRFSQTGDIYTGKIHLKDAVAYIDVRGEHEILALPGKVKDIRKLECKTINDVYDDYPDLPDNYVFEAMDIKEDYFLNPESIHGVLHAKRVLLLSHIIGLYEGLTDEDMEIVLTAAKYHDIGRTNDNYDEIHGILSFNKMRHLELLDETWEEEDIHILQFIIDNHCIPDERGIKNLDNYPIHDRDRAIYLYQILKDADGLDRVRLGDTDIKYLRLPISKELFLVAQQIYQHLK